MSSENEGCGERISDLRSFSFSASQIRSSVVKWVRECSNISLMNIIAKNSPKTVSFLKMPIEQLSLTSSDNLIWSLRLYGSTSFRNKQFPAINWECQAILVPLGMTFSHLFLQKSLMSSETEGFG